MQIIEGRPGEAKASPVGDRLVIEVHDADDDCHDLVLPTGARTQRIPAGQIRTLALSTEGAYRLRPGEPAAGGAQVLTLGPAAGGFVELTPPPTRDLPVRQPPAPPARLDGMRNADV